MLGIKGSKKIMKDDHEQINFQKEIFSIDAEIPYGWLSHPILEEHIEEFGLAGIEKNHLMNSPGPY